MKKIDDELTYKIIGCAMKVHNTLGNGFTHGMNTIFNGIRECFAFQEVIYQRCLAIELDKNGINYEREKEMPIYYEGIQVGTRRADFIIEEKVMVELKAIVNLEDVHLAQGLNYLTAYNLETGLLINFGSTSLQTKRLFKKH